MPELDESDRDIIESFTRLKKASPVILEGKTDRYHESMESEFYEIVDTQAKRFGVRNAVWEYGCHFDYEAHKRGDVKRALTYNINFGDEQSATKLINGINSDNTLPYIAKVPDGGLFISDLRFLRRLD